MPVRVLALAPNPVEAAATRYRLSQYVPHLAARGIQCRVSPFLSPSLFQDFYNPRGIPRKALAIGSAALRRIADVARSMTVDAVIIAREAMLFGPPVIEWAIGRVLRCPIVFDFDDAIFVPYSSPTYGRMANLLKCAWKTSTVLRMSRHVLAGNEYLAHYARQHNSNVTVLPTVVDLPLYQQAARQRESSQLPVIGWIGTHSTAQYLDLIKPALAELATRHQFVLRIIGAGIPVSIPGVHVENRPWSLERDMLDFACLDIGLYPLKDDPWARGKCAFKAIQYMAAGVASVSSPVGMVTEVVEHGVNGLLAATQYEWIASLETLLTDPALRSDLACAGRETIQKRYSLEMAAPILAKVLHDVAGSRASARA
jgi:glycosyltransferase involved in cell wall biosynthesis